MEKEKESGSRRPPSLDRAVVYALPLLFSFAAGVMPRSLALRLGWPCGCPKLLYGHFQKVRSRPTRPLKAGTVFFSTIRETKDSK